MTTLGITPAFTREQLDFYFQDQSSYQYHQIRRAGTAILRAFLRTPLEQALEKALRSGNQQGQDLLEYWADIKEKDEWDLLDRWWLLYLLSEHGYSLPIYASREDAQKAFIQAEKTFPSRKAKKWQQCSHNEKTNC